ncbi:hypothetical protein T3A99_06045 [Pseudomonas sp. N-137]|uniref:hypothetical protein n=1 Tax=Pseudomonas sp. N-137 TaxID=3108452 RepID=UPI002ADEE6C4|nr:hypothetical protein [Pseudomonas sp. N-137]MEA1028128.1 hypothetical protein [Pseudomonas sp. N-137]
MLKHQLRTFAYINANMIRNWMPRYQDQLPAALPAFFPLRATPKRPEEALGTIELSLLSITLKRPTSDPKAGLAIAAITKCSVQAPLQMSSNENR